MTVVNDYLTSFEKDISNFSAPASFTFPFSYQPHPLSSLACEQLQRELLQLGLTETEFAGAMFGILVVETSEGDMKFLSAVSGSAKNNRRIPQALLSKLTPTLSDKVTQSSDFLSIQQTINDITSEKFALEEAPDYLQLVEDCQQAKNQASAEIVALQNQLAINRKQRKEIRKSIEDKLSEACRLTDPAAHQSAVEVSISLARESVADKKSIQALKRQWQQVQNDLQHSLSSKRSSIEQLGKDRKKLSNKLIKSLFRSMTFLNAKQESENLLDIFKQEGLDKPPAGAGDCAAPKLLQFAYANDLKPLCMAEFWWGKSPSSEIRKHGYFYPACQGKCLPILGHMLKGLPVDANPLLINPAEKLELEIVYADEHLVVVNKPAGLLSVPGKSIIDSVYTRIKEAYPDAQGNLILHRLDMATSGLLVLSLSNRAHKHLQKQFINKEIAKRYVAEIDGIIQQASGTIELPLITDHLDRPRQKVCFQTGKRAKTEWQVINRTKDSTKLYMYPITGRTHQLRVHCAHPEGLNTPIIGDNLYGTPADRLKLHAQRLSFIHPVNKETLVFEIEPDF